ncbi:MAG: translation initiation factor IF-2 [Anaerolineae bacterium]|nr:translation initiation factor IF-2 [Anaerolineae bacterium]
MPSEKQQEKQVLVIPDYLTVRELADVMHSSPIEVMKQLIANGIMASINQQIDFDTAAIVLNELGFEAKSQSEVDAEQARQQALENLPDWRKQYARESTDKLSVRPPVVAVLGHVDHGKTSLLDVIRKAAVAEGEAGGITQHIGAYQVEHKGSKITFLDTPGHEAFTAMRARGAQGADIVILVVAADDGVMPTTREAISHARAAGTPIIVALNKVDKPNANPDRVKQQLSEVGLTPDEWDGDTMVVPVSAKNKIGIEDLLEAVSLTASECDIRANPTREARGVVLEASKNPARGPVATLLVQNGTLRTGDTVIVGTVHGRIKGMFDEYGNKVLEALPSKPVSVMGLTDTPTAGETFEVVKDVKAARRITQERQLVAAEQNVRVRQTQTLESLFAQFQAGDLNELRLIVKADVNGSLEPIVNSLQNIQIQEKDLKVDVVHSDIGDISENDVNLAQSTGAIIIGFNVEPDNAARRAAESHHVDIRTYSIIYKLIEDVELALHGLLEPEYEDKVIGVAEVRKVFKIPRIGNIAGSYILNGIARRNAKARVRRGSEIISESQGVTSLKRMEEDVREVRAGFECGIGLGNFHDFREGDHIEFVVRERVN